jgi:hypothetical protein
VVSKVKKKWGGHGHPGRCASYATIIVSLDLHTNLDRCHLSTESSSGSKRKTVVARTSAQSAFYEIPTMNI